MLLTRALEEARALRAPALEAAVLNDLGNLAATEGKTQDALERYRESAAIARAQNLHAHTAAVYSNIANLRLQQPDVEGALAALAEAAREIGRIVEPREKVFPLLVSRRAARPRVRDHEAARAARAKLPHASGSARDRAAEKRSSRDLARARGARAALSRRRPSGRSLAAFAELALAAAQTSDAADLQYRWHWLAARALLGRGRTDEALAAYRRAVQRFQIVRVDLIQELNASRTSYRDTVGPLFIELADLLLTRAKAQSEPQKILAEARDVVEQFRSVELEDYFKDECVAQLQSRRRAIETVAADTAVLYPIFLPDRTEMLLSVGGSLRQITVPVKADALTAEIHAFRQMLEKRTTNQYLPHAQRLYQWLFKPIERELAGGAITTIVLIPDGALRNIPMAALHDGKQFLVHRFAFGVAPGLSLLEPRPLATERNARAPLGALRGGAAVPAVAGGARRARRDRAPRPVTHTAQRGVQRGCDSRRS